MKYLLAWFLLLMNSAGMAQSLSSGALDAQTPVTPVRLTVNGSQIFDQNHQPFIPRGYNWAQGALPVQDAMEHQSQGITMVRFTPAWYKNSDCVHPIKASGDAYDPTMPGNFDTTVLAVLDQEVQALSNQHIWMDIGITTGSCAFYTDPVIQDQFNVMWSFIANRYKNVPYVGFYEPTTEPSPTGDAYNNELVKTIYRRVIKTIRAADPSVPIVVGSAKNYDCRALDLINMPDVSNLIYTCNFYELAGGGGNSADSDYDTTDVGYVKQVKIGQSFGFQGPFTGYPGFYADTRGLNATALCNYAGKGQRVYMDQKFLAGIIDCGTQFSKAKAVPIFFNQVGLYTLTPNAWQYMSDTLDTMNARGFGWTVWVYRSAGFKKTNVSDGYNGGNSAGQPIWFQDDKGKWRRKDSSYICPPTDWGSAQGYGISTCDNWFDMIGSKVNAH